MNLRRCSIIVGVFVVLAVFVLEQSPLRVEAAPPVQSDVVTCGPPERDHVVAWFVCEIEAQDRRLDQLEARLARLEQGVGGTLSERRVEEIAWQKASDRLDLWKRESQAYQDRWFFDQVYQRWRVHACRNAVPILVPCP